MIYSFEGIVKAMWKSLGFWVRRSGLRAWKEKRGDNRVWDQGGGGKIWRARTALFSGSRPWSRQKWRLKGGEIQETRAKEPMFGEIPCECAGTNALGLGFADHGPSCVLPQERSAHSVHRPLVLLRTTDLSAQSVAEATATLFSQSVFLL